MAFQKHLKLFSESNRSIGLSLFLKHQSVGTGEMAQWVKGTCNQAWKSAFDPWDKHYKRREPTPSSHHLTLQHLPLHTPQYKYFNKWNKKPMSSKMYIRNEGFQTKIKGIPLIWKMLYKCQRKLFRKEWNDTEWNMELQYEMNTRKLLYVSINDDFSPR